MIWWLVSPTKNTVNLLRDVGTKDGSQYDSWSKVIRQRGVDMINEYSERRIFNEMWMDKKNRTKKKSILWHLYVIIYILVIVSTLMLHLMMKRTYYNIFLDNLFYSTTCILHYMYVTIYQDIYLTTSEINRIVQN